MENITNVSIKTRRELSIDEDELSEFYRLYAAAAQYFPMYIIEMPDRDVRPIDFDFRFPTKKVETNQYRRRRINRE